MGKLPAFPFYPNDWARDLEEHPLEIEGAWIRICCKLWWSDKRGSVTKALQQWARILREPLGKTLYILQYLQSENIGNIKPDLKKLSENPDCNVSVTVESRRMVNDEKVREQTRLRVKRHREKEVCNGAVTPMKHSLSVSSSLLGTNVPNCPQKEIVDLWHVTLPQLPKIKIWDETRQGNLRARWKEDESRQTVEWWQRFFEYFKGCPFLMGEVPPTNRHKQFYATLDWVIKKQNFIKIIEGRYEEK
uniref:Uncharacterized protein n=1 Tax=viral metagenome TaxID=1070528 RepID=A0A6H1ZZM1_9ZZZZ